MPQQVTMERGVIGHVIQLQNFASALERLMAVPAVIRHFEQQASAKRGRNFGNIIVETLAVFQNPQPTAFGFPNRIEVKQHGQKLGFCVGVYAAVT